MRTEGQLRDIHCGDRRCDGYKVVEERFADSREGIIFDNTLDTAKEVRCVLCDSPMQNYVMGARFAIGGGRSRRSVTASGTTVESNGTVCEEGRHALGDSAVQALGPGGSGTLQVGEMGFHATVSSGARNVEIVRTDI